jgi:S1-C subfamily serine protease
LDICEGEPHIGQHVFAIGNPLGLDFSMSSGIISGLERSISNEDNKYLINMIQTDAAINPGNSGGPLISLNKFRQPCVIGMNTAIMGQGIGLAIPSKQIIDSLESYDTNITNPIIQLGVILLPDKYADVFNITGAIISDILPGSIAEKNGLISSSRDDFGRPLIGDIIIGINDKKIDSVMDLYKIMNLLTSEHFTLHLLGRDITL